MTTIIEAGHYYESNGPSNMSVIGWGIGKTVAADCVDGQMVLFVDDYHAEQKYLEKGDFFFDDPSVAGTMMYEANFVFSENELSLTAASKLAEFADSKLVKVKKGIVSAAGVRLGVVEGSDFETVEPTCVLLDLLLLIEKAKLGKEQVVVLPLSYEKQQKQLFAVTGKIAVPGLSGYTAILHDANGQVKEFAL